MRFLSLDSPWLFVDGLPLHYMTEDMTELFSHFGAARAVRLQQDHTGASLRCAYIQMESHADAERVILQLMTDPLGKELRAMHIDPPF